MTNSAWIATPAAQARNDEPQTSMRGARWGKMAVQIDGVLLLDKPVGPSSTRVLSHVKKLFNAKKAGHGGTLDPMASGLLPIMFGEATKYAADGLDADKVYEATICLGVKTTTGDAEGGVIATADLPRDLNQERIELALRKFLGIQSQMPPLFSALKKDGKPMYAYARAGQEVERTMRTITIHEIALIRIELPLLIIRVACSKGTYIRTLAEDIGQALGLPAHLQALRRTGVGRLVGADLVPLEFIESAASDDLMASLKPVDWLLRGLPEIELASADIEKFRNGQKVSVTATVAHGTRVRVKNQSGVFLGTGLLDSPGRLTPERVRVLSR